MSEIDEVMRLIARRDNVAAQYTREAFIDWLRKDPVFPQGVCPLQQYIIATYNVRLGYSSTRDIDADLVQAIDDKFSPDQLEWGHVTAQDILKLISEEFS